MIANSIPIMDMFGIKSVEKTIIDSDIVIIGAGIAGLAAATKISSISDRSVVVVERNSVGSNNPSPLTFADVMRNYDLIDCCKEGYTSFIFHNYQGSRIEHRFDDIKLVVLDYEKACNKLFNKLNSTASNVRYVHSSVKSVEQQAGWACVHLEDNTNIKAKIVIDASGKDQFLARQNGNLESGIYSHVYGGMFSGVDNPAGKLCCFLLPNPYFGSGGGWFYSIGADYASFGYATISNNPKPDYRRLKQNFEDALCEFQPYADYLKGAKLVNVESGVIPISYIQKFSERNMIIIGDAGGMATSWTCMGVEPALKYGTLAGKLSVRALLENDYDVFVELQKKWDMQEKTPRDLFAKNISNFWTSDNYFWEWIIKNDLAFLTPRQLLARLRWNSHILKWYQIVPRAISYKISTFFNKQLSLPKQINKSA